MPKLYFLKSRRWWAAVGAALVWYMQNQHWIPQTEATFIVMLAGAFITLETLNKFIPNKRDTNGRFSK